MTAVESLANGPQYNRIFAFLNGRDYMLDGVMGKMQHMLYMGRYPRPQVYEHLYHVANEVGKASPLYVAVKEALGDDHFTDLTANEDMYCAIALELGYTEDWMPARIVMNRYSTLMGELLQ